MRIDLINIFSKQKELDQEIHAKHKVNYSSISEELKLALIVELAELSNEIRSFKFWSTKGPAPKERILEEYVDAIHFITSICICYDLKPELNIEENVKKFVNVKEITNCLINLFTSASGIDSQQKAISWYESFIEFGLKLGLTLDEITNSYMEKNKINHQRQENNY